MNEIFMMVPALVMGIVLGGMFFGGLWWTIRKGLSSTQPAFWFIGSLLIRTGLTLAGFYVVSDGHWVKLLVCLFGFTMARPIVTRLTGLADNSIRPEQGPSHAP